MISVQPVDRQTVSVSINSTEHRIARGNHTVAALKKLGGVALADDLEQVIDGRLTPLRDDGSVVIEGGERFVSHPKDAGSS